MNSPIINVMSAAALKAGKGLLRDFGEVDRLQVSRKGTANFVTESDLRTEKLLRRELSKARPGFGFLLEEGGEIPGKDENHRFIIDPLDGTSNFIHAIPYFCISIALEKRERGLTEIVAAVTFDPIHNEMFTAEKHQGAFLNNRRITVSSRARLEDAMVVTATPRSAKAAVPPGLTSQYGVTLRCLGATALDMAYLAAGRIDACWYHSFQPWDVAAGLLLVQEAGGMATDLAGAPAHIGSSSLLAANRELLAPMRTMLSGK